MVPNFIDRGFINFFNNECGENKISTSSYQEDIDQWHLIHSHSVFFHCVVRTILLNYFTIDWFLLSETKKYLPEKVSSADIDWAARTRSLVGWIAFCLKTVSTESWSCQIKQGPRSSARQTLRKCYIKEVGGKKLNKTLGTRDINFYLGLYSSVFLSRSEAPERKRRGKFIARVGLSATRKAKIESDFRAKNIFHFYCYRRR